ncbi:MAG TPA: TerB family tellurite resistance protein [bacterium]|nr:TerB family tellurite resistance protein [bacterium]HOL47830.1 TerB family tellurite resistance protein [bacterium]HPQ19543.1 TerB family tellurite resistance protein [bacterium]
MLNWNAILGAGAGFLLGGPLGALVGGVVGYLLSNENIEQAEDVKANSYNNLNVKEQSVFLVSLIALLVKITQVDGNVSQQEIREIKNFFKDKLKFTDENLRIVKSIIKETLNSNLTIDEIAYEFKKFSNPYLNIELINVLFRIAFADEKFVPAEENYIRRVAKILEISETEYESIKSQFIKEKDKYYKILGLTKEATNEEIKAKYRELITQYHPDKIMAKGLPEDFVEFANQRLKAINEAYDKIKKERNIK